MKAIRMILMVLISLAFSLGMFYCFQAGAPTQEGTGFGYTVVSALFSLLAPAALAACWAYIRYLQEKLEDAMQEFQEISCKKTADSLYCKGICRGQGTAGKENIQ